MQAGESRPDANVEIPERSEGEPVTCGWSLKKHRCFCQCARCPFPQEQSGMPAEAGHDTHPGASVVPKPWDLKKEGIHSFTQQIFIEQIGRAHV